MQEHERITVHGPYDTDTAAMRDAAHVNQAARDHRYPPAEMHALTPFHSVARIPVADRINEGLLLAALGGAGVELGAYDRRIIGWFAGWEPSIVQVVIGWIERAHAAGHGAGNLAANWAHHVAAQREPVLHWPSRGLKTTTACQGEPLTPASFAAREQDVTCPDCRARLDEQDGGA